MNDDKNKHDEFEDFDFDNFDDLDDEPLDNDMIIEAESIHEDVIVDDLAAFDENDDWSDVNSSDMPQDVSEKSSKSKLILPAALGVIALAGAGYFFLSSGAPSAPPAPAPTADMGVADSGFPSEDELAQDGSIPMPSPISAPENTDPQFAQDEYSQGNAPVDPFAQSSADAGAPMAETNADVLTPMPNAASQNEMTAQPDAAAQDPNNVALAELDLEVPPASPAEPQDISDIPVQDGAPISGQDQINITEITETSPTIDESLDAQVTAPVDPLAEAPVEISASETEITNQNTGTPEISEPAVAAAPADLQNEELQALEIKLSDLEQSVSQKNQTIQELNNQIAALENSLKSSQESLQAIEEQNSRQSSAPAEPVATAQSQPATAEPAPAALIPEQPAAAPKAAPAPKTTSAPKAKTEAKPKWELRSAQPGKAYVGIAGSSEVLVVEVGDTLQGVGRITSIAKNGTKWVVSGSSGEITR